MQKAPPRDDEAQALAALQSLEVLDSEPEAEFDALVRAASLACDTPIALISLVDAERQWFKANIGLPGVTQTSRDVAFCAHAVLGEDLLEVPDAALDPRFEANPLVTGGPNVRFYAGAPIRLRGGHKVGTLCIIDRQSRELSDTQREILACLATAAARALEGRKAALQLKRTMLENEERLRRLYEATPAMLHSIDSHGRVHAVSDMWLAKMGYAREDVVGRVSTDFLTPASREYALNVVRPKFFASGHCDQVEYQMTASDGSLIDILLSATLERDGEGRPFRSLAVSEDVTLRRKAERALATESQRLANIIEGTDVATLELNVRTGELRVNQRFAQMLGRSVDESRPTSIAEWMAYTNPEDRARHDQLLREHLAGRSALFQCEIRVRHADGHWVWVLTRGRVIAMADDGQPEWLYGVRLDISVRKRQEEALRRSEEFLERTGRVAGVGGWELDVATGQVTWSDETRRIHAVAADFQPQLSEAIHFYAPEARPTIQAAVATAMSNGTPWDLELPLIRADGQRIWARAVGAAEMVDGKPVRLAGAFQDITERKRLETQLAASSDRVRDLYDNAPCGYHSLDPDGRILHINATALDWLGCSREEAIGKRLPSEFFTAEGQLQFERNFGRLKATGRVEGLEFDLVPRRGAGRRVSITATAVYDEQSRYAMSRTVMFDITELHRVRQELNQSLMEQSATLDNELVGLVKVRDRRFVWVNRGMGRIFGYEPSELVGQRTAGLYADSGDYRDVGEATGSARLSGQTFRTQLKMSRKDGSVLWVDMSSVLLSETSGESLALFVDITPLKDAEAARIKAIALDAENAQLRETSRLKDQFVANMSHELRTPLNAVIGFAQMLQTGVVRQESPKYIPYLTHINTSGQHLLQLIESMLDYAETASGKIEFRPEPVNLADALQDVIDMLQAQCIRRHVTIFASVSAEVAQVQLDPMRLRQVLLNLVGNAVKFSDDGGLVEVRALSVGGTHLRIEIEDAGIGIAAADMPSLFTQFNQLSAGNTKSHEGTGLGLALVRRMVEAQGGEVGVSSTLGSGSVFYVMLPLLPVAFAG